MGVSAAGVGRSVRVRSAEEAAAALRAANTDSGTVCPVGGGTHQFLTDLPTNGTTFLHLADLDDLVDYQPADLTVTVQPGMSLARLQHTVDEKKQWVALEAADPERATIGGILATAWAGPLRLGYGRPRDQVLGMRFVTGDGVPAKAGGRVVKNVAGYDLCRLLVGSHGTLAVITEVTLRVRPRPEREETVVARFDGVEEAVHAAEAVWQTRWAPTMLTLQNEQRAARLFVGSDGDSDSVAAQSAAIAELLRARGAQPQVLREDRWHEAPPRQALRAAAVPESGHGLRVSLLPSDLGALLTTVGSESQSAVAHYASGIAHLRFAPGAAAAMNAVRRFALAHGGAAVLEGPSVDGFSRWGPRRPDYALMQRLKTAFDPRGVLPPLPFGDEAA